MKNALLIALTLVSVSAFAGGKVSKEARTAAAKACKEQGVSKKDKAAWKSCMKEHITAPTAEAK